MAENKFAIKTRDGEVITLTKDVCIKYLTDNVQISDSEFTMFFQLCKAYKLNPFLRECYIIKYGGQPATIVMDYKVLQQIAEDNPSFNGMKHGVIVEKADGSVEERLGSYCLKNETLIAGWCEVYRKDHDNPTKVVAMFDEFKAAKKDGSLNSNWAGKPCFMITKVAKAQALREAFPNAIGTNIYTPEEIEKDEVKPDSDKKTTVSNKIVLEETDLTSGEEISAELGF